MDPTEIANIKQKLDEISAIDIGAKLAALFPIVDLSEKLFSPLNANELVSLTDRMVLQLRAELDSPSSKLLPKGFYWETVHHGMGHRQIQQVIQSMLTGLTNANWDQAAQHLELAIGFQMTCGFWDRGPRKLHSSSRLKQNELFANLDTKSHQLEELIALVGSQNETFSKELQARRSDVQSVATLLKDAETKVQQIGQILNQASTNDGKLSQILTDQNANLETAKSELQGVAKQKADLQSLLKKAADALETSQERLKFMQDKAAVVNEIAGTAGAGLLGQKFEARTRELAKASSWWLWGTVVSLVVAAVWLGIAHTYFVVKDADIWKTLAANFGLLLPSIFLVGFFAKQFGKIRQFEEEYAFRSSIAMTVSAFADKLADTKEAKDKLITETVEKLYRMPAGLHADEKKGGFFQERALQRTLKSAADLLREVKRVD
jgi:hypothetical protein